MSFSSIPKICSRGFRSFNLSELVKCRSTFSPRTTLRAMSSSTPYQFETLKVTEPKEFVKQVELNRPEKLNAMNRAFWREMVECFSQLDEDPDCRVVVLTAAGPTFTAGLDLTDFGEVLQSSSDADIARKAMILQRSIRSFQQSFTQIEKCTKPVIAAIHGACIGGGVDMITACDIRYCSHDAWFQIKEVDIGLAADVGTLQRLPKVIGNDSLARELAYTARKLFSDEAKQVGLVSRLFSDKKSLLEGAMETACLIASKSPVAVQGSKVAIVYARDNTVDNSLNQIVMWNQAMLQSEDLMKAVMAQMQKQTGTFSKL